MSKNVFVLMPFHDSMKDLWRFGIREPCVKLGWACSRADDRYDFGAIIQKILREISMADLVIAELTEKNANVFYELGLAHALGKPTVLLSRSEEDLTAFDTRGYQHILHNGRAHELSIKLSEALAQIVLPLEYAPRHPNAETIFEWPSRDHERPFLEWRNARHSERTDVNGGQSFQRIEPVGSIIAVTDTGNYWNHHPGCSIMRLGSRTHIFHRGDTVSILFEANVVSSDATVSLTGDGGPIESSEISWAHCWKEKSVTLSPTYAWTRRIITATVEPTHTDYDPSKRGTTLYLKTSTGAGTVYYKRIEVTRIRSQS